MILFEPRQRADGDGRAALGAKSFTGGQDKWRGTNERREKNDLEYPRLSRQTRLPRDSMDLVVFHPPWKMSGGKLPRRAIPRVQRRSVAAGKIGALMNIPDIRRALVLRLHR